ncbi:hypothetical protein [Pseudomonas sp. A-B-19]|nr:hypothetical protein [Pseudomonas sp. A-B-19]
MSQLRRLVIALGGFMAEPVKDAYNVENTLAETFNLDWMARYSILAHP